jgi:hypothetical protein
VGRKAIIREAIRNVLKKSDDPLSFTTIKKRVAQELHREKEAVKDQNISYNLKKLIEGGEVEKSNTKGKNTYNFSNSFYKVKNKTLIKSLIDNANLEEFYPRFEDDTNPPLTAYFNNFENLIDPLRQKRVQYFSTTLNNWSDPLDLINRRMLESYTDLDVEEKMGIKELLRHAYWFGVQSLIKNYGLGPLSDVLSKNKDFAFQCIEKAAKEWKDPKRVEAENTIIQILNITGEILLKKNLNELFLFFKKQDLEIKKLQNQLLSLTGELMSAGERIYDSFQEFHNCVLVGLQAAELIPESAKKGYLPKEYRYLINYSDVWDQTIFSIISQFSTQEELEGVNGDLNQTLNKIKEHEKHLFSFMDLPFRSKMFMVYVWGYPEVFEVSDRDFLPMFEQWFSALKEGHLDHRSWIFDKKSVSTIIQSFNEVKKGRIPPDGIIDIEPWTIRSLYFFHPRGKDESFWKELLIEINARLFHLKHMNREVARDIEAVLKGGY